MLKILVSLFILMTFTTSVLDCSIEMIAKGDAVCNLAKCNSDQADQHKSAAGHHCHLSCSHIAVVNLKFVSVGVRPPESLIHTSYRSLLYKNPFLKSHKRPPLSA